MTDAAMESSRIARDIGQIYDRFEILPDLRMHMERVTAVGELIIDNLPEGIELYGREDVVAALLLHDLGNIVKFDFSDSSMWQGYTEKEMRRWLGVRERVAAHYNSTDDHLVTQQMAAELGASGRVLFLVSGMLLENMNRVIHSEDLALKICAYSDQRVAPRGVVTLAERFRDLRRRYAHRPGRLTLNDGSYALVEELERQVLGAASMAPGDISDGSLTAYLGRYGH